jgi:hypothetical protein
MERKKITEEDARLVENLVSALRNRKPVLKNPEGLTDDIMKAVHELSADDKTDKSVKSRQLPAIIMLRRLLAAASVCLFLVFGYEEYVVVEKISQLEKQSSAISRSADYQAALNLKKVITILTVNPKMINQYMESRTKKISLGTLFKAAMFADAAGITPEALKKLNRAGYDLPDQAVRSLLNNFDSTHHFK